MLDQSVFTETIHEVAEIIRTSATPLSKRRDLKLFQRDGVKRTAGKHGFRVSADTT